MRTVDVNVTHEFVNRNNIVNLMYYSAGCVDSSPCSPFQVTAGDSYSKDHDVRYITFMTIQGREV